MDYPIILHYNPDETPEQGTQRLGLLLLDHAEHFLQHAESLDIGLHETRKDFKKLRALLRLVRSGMNEETYKNANRALRDAARLLSDARDSAVLVESISLLGERHPDIFHDEGFQEIKQQLQKRHQQQLKILRTHRTTDQVLMVIKALKDTVHRWTLDKEDFSAFSAGILKAYGRGITNRGIAREDTTADHLHEWRKRVKDLYYQLGYLQMIWPPVMLAWETALGELADLLGLDHDLAVLQQTLKSEESTATNLAGHRLLAGLVHEERSQLQSNAWSLGRRLYAEDPESFVSRLNSYWEAMKDPGSEIRSSVPGQSAGNPG
ncbi:CHAD domain-containing protein [Zeaxanthinibacter enoshimensis]|uniref:CHAD domain-containing protein n=1 Tax=Zeaxanthinibacter enoshimensis TaxID=392009 RepID=A0A4R6TMG8_9FLAO|nr:CHAD domain-containing protein [Zeaxanthinibacter enoshimensis]TDQ32644.1 CHAD domain-containing protein [Zeaxanthinibacter enoshimensis]